MDFLDPDYKRRHNIILLVGQTLIGIAIITAAILLVYKAYGYDVDRKTGQVVQSGLVYVDSAPDNALIKINDEVHNDRTNTRFTLPAGSYTVKLEKDQYRAWERSFELSGSDVERFTYPTLFLDKLSSAVVSSDASLTNLFSQSPDRKWLIFAENQDFSSLREFNLAEAENNNEVPPSRSVALPANIFTKSTNPGATFEIVEWSNNNANFLVKHVFDGKTEYVLLNRDEPAKSLNLTTLGVAALEGEITLLDKSADKFLVHNKVNKTLVQYDLKDKKATALLNGVVAYKSHGDDRILYAHTHPSDVNKYVVSVLDNKKNYDIREIPAATNVPLDIAGFHNKMYMVIGVEKEGRTYIYEDFVKKFKNDTLTKPGPIRVLKNDITSPLQVSFSKNVRFIASFSGDDVSIFDIEKIRNYRYNLDASIAATESPLWMDGHRLVYVSAGKVWVVDFDGSNKRELTDLSTIDAMFFDRDYNSYYTLQSTPDNKKNLQKTDIRLKEDR